MSGPIKQSIIRALSTNSSPMIPARPRPGTPPQTMAATTATGIDPAALADFHQHLLESRRIIALCGAGLSAASGLPTFRGPGGLWRTHKSTALATPGAWDRDPGLVWQFYGYRRHMALSVKPNEAHYALAELAMHKPYFQCLSQNVDGLSQRAGHPPGQLQLLHGSLFRVKCDRDACDYSREDFTDPFCPALALPSDGHDPTTTTATQELDISDPNVEISSVHKNDLPRCPQCLYGRLRPGVVWFGEALPRDTLSFIDDYIKKDHVDLVLVIGTSAQVWPAAGYVAQARSHKTRVAVINMDADDIPPGRWTDRDWMFQGDASVIVPELLRPVVGDLSNLM